MEKEMRTVPEIIQKLREKHFIHDFCVKDEKISSNETGETFSPEDLIIERIYRYEGESDPGDMSVVYGITSKSGTRGILIDAYGTYADPEVAEVITKIPVREVDENQATA
ncbi:MAG: phosphoribosylpyrophosphate synthetase [Ignavibacteria bacterium]